MLTCCTFLGVKYRLKILVRLKDLHFATLLEISDGKLCLLLEEKNLFKATRAVKVTEERRDEEALRSAEENLIRLAGWSQFKVQEEPIE